MDPPRNQLFVSIPKLEGSRYLKSRIESGVIWITGKRNSKLNMASKVVAFSKKMCPIFQVCEKYVELKSELWFLLDLGLITRLFCLCLCSLNRWYTNFPIIISTCFLSYKLKNQFSRKLSNKHKFYFLSVTVNV